MAMENDKIKDLFSSKLGSFEPEVPASVWGGLDLLLSNQPASTTDAGSSSSSTNSSSSATSSSGNASIIKTVAIIVGLAAAVAAGVLFIPKGKDVMVEDKKENVITTDDAQSLPEAADTLQIIPDLPIAIKATPRAYMEEIPEEAPVEEGIPEIVAVETERTKEEKEVAAEEKTFVAIDEVMAPEIKILGGGFSIGIRASANLSTENINEQGGGLLFSRDVRSSALMNALKEENADYKLQHRQPVSFGVTISKQVTSRLSLETGLVYTYLSSKITSDSKFNIEESQNFNYLGIPLSLNYTFYQIGNTRFYVSVGGMVQKDIKGKYTSDMNFVIQDMDGLTIADQIFYTEPYYIRKSIKQNNPQFSTYATLGITCPLYKKMYLYGTVGGAYYFDAGNEYRTIYSDKKFQLNLDIGLKFDF